MNRKPHRVLKELKHYVDDSQMVQQRISSCKDRALHYPGQSACPCAL